MPPKPAPKKVGSPERSSSSKGGDMSRPLAVAQHQNAIADRHPDLVEKAQAAPVAVEPLKRQEPVAKDLEPQTVSRTLFGASDTISGPQELKAPEKPALPEVVDARKPESRPAPEAVSPGPREASDVPNVNPVSRSREYEAPVGPEPIPRPMAPELQQPVPEEIVRERKEIDRSRFVNRDKPATSTAFFHNLGSSKDQG